MIKFRGKHIRALSLDVTGTILRFRAPIGDLYNEAIANAGHLPPQPADMQKAFISAYRLTDAEHPCFGSTSLTSREWWSLCVRRALATAVPALSFSSSSSVALAEDLYDVFASASPYTLLPGAKELVLWASQKGVIVGITSNADERYPDNVLPALGLPPLSFAVLSKTAPAPKPDPRIFSATLNAANAAAVKFSDASTVAYTTGNTKPRSSLEIDQAGPARVSSVPLLLPRDLLHVGDSFKADFRGITAFGGTGVLLHHGNEAVQKQYHDMGVPKELSLADLEALLAALQTENPGL